MPPTQHVESLMGACIERAGFRKGVRLASWVVQYATAKRELGDDATIEQGAEFWHEGRATWTRRHAEWRAAFPGVAVGEVAIALNRTAAAGHSVSDTMAAASRHVLSAT